MFFLLLHIFSILFSISNTLDEALLTCFQIIVVFRGRRSSGRRLNGSTQTQRPRLVQYLTGLSDTISSFFLSFLFRSCSVFFSLSGTRRSLDCMSLITSCRSESEGNVRWHTGQQGSLSSVSWLINWVYTAVAPASMAIQGQVQKEKTKEIVSWHQHDKYYKKRSQPTKAYSAFTFTKLTPIRLKLWSHWENIYDKMTPGLSWALTSAGFYITGPESPSGGNLSNFSDLDAAFIFGTVYSKVQGENSNLFLGH